MNLDQLTLGDIKQLQALLSGNVSQAGEPLCEVGKCYFLRTVTHHYLGRCTKVNGAWIELEDAAWIPDDGRFSDFLKTGNANEVEPFVDPVKIMIGTILDITEWRHALKMEQK